MSVQAFSLGRFHTRVAFGSGAVTRLPDELDRLGVHRSVVISTPGQRVNAERLASMLGTRCAHVHPHATAHVPVDVVRAACAATEDADGLVAFGGGSAIGLAKAVAVASGLPVIAVPTTYSGSEMTAVWGVTEDGHKSVGSDARAAPRCVVYDPILTTTLPVPLSVASGMNAIAHAVEALYSPDRTSLVSLVAERGITAVARALPVIADDPGDPAARAKAMYGALLCGMSLGCTTMSLHHKVCHVLGGLGLDHAGAHTVLLPHVLRLLAPAIPAAMTVLRRALDAPDPVAALTVLADVPGVAHDLADLGLVESQLDYVVDRVAAAEFPAPVRATRPQLRALLAAAMRA